jgi:bifunctional UDP-N-acetylglucosamine pyrophosphorylase/glucosamine-1-phosphate N-acetyltransferase
VNIDVVILAAGQGTRMRSALPKVLHPLAGKPLVKHVIDTAKKLDNMQMQVIIGHGGELVKESFPDDDIHWVVQQEQLGTGHAVLQALPHLQDDSITLILYGDVPLISQSSLQQMVSLVNEQSIALLTIELNDAAGYGRIVRSASGAVTAIVEHKDADNEQLRIKEINTGILAVKSAHLRDWLPKLSNDNSQKEYYLTDIIAMAAELGISIATVHPRSENEVQGVNNRMQLSDLERWYQLQQARTLQENGVTLIDPTRFDLRGELETGIDVFIDSNVIFEGVVKIGSNVKIGPNCVIRDCVIADNVEINANCVLEETSIADGATIGPFARLRPGTVLAKNTKVGNFVEIKKSFIGEDAKVNHLSYIGDTVMGKSVNVGAGTITCNYDGANKFKTIIDDGAFIGSNSSIVAPTKIGKDATIAAGSTITKEVGNEQLAIARGKQRNIDDWPRPVKKI